MGDSPLRTPHFRARPSVVLAKAPVPCWGETMGGAIANGPRIHAAPDMVSSPVRHAATVSPHPTA